MLFLKGSEVNSKPPQNQTQSAEELEAIARLRERLVDAQTATTDAEQRWEAVNEQNVQLQRDVVALTASVSQANQLAVGHAETHWKEEFQSLKDELALARDAAVALAVQQAHNEAAQSLKTQREALVGIGAVSLSRQSLLTCLSFLTD